MYQCSSCTHQLIHVFYVFYLLMINVMLIVAPCILSPCILDKAEACLRESEKLLVECTEGDYKDNSTCLECLRDMKMASKDISQQVSG